mmetsp:Transcript_82705/g.145987  ORF Transcript_82705/g.145987 Transcript_82705/m.145987 type:complete len:334 (-) Transcript_82705:291-1292(-)|eukprot:CAMPEP_0197692836 /NCGR_PEP_ID=MMETSP1338-20131121/111650_1 /TAXON_ID=43686 ORGANISM="Pelagodinium beii, Strain RCC1491" /NCGR_SAMPLE_ID=MMETSP1338 /ASSEMBLY_ACC=CAM_ASM_000754 /LENGTH=333 /DNA_ID=CAMNT_0043275531 /DNA_START=49 /DNA_END=1050 /DNA_ORIENTATION=-
MSCCLEPSALSALGAVLVRKTNKKAGRVKDPVAVGEDDADGAEASAVQKVAEDIDQQRRVEEEFSDSPAEDAVIKVSFEKKLLDGAAALQRFLGRRVILGDSFMDLVFVGDQQALGHLMFVQERSHTHSEQADGPGVDRPMNITLLAKGGVKMPATVLVCTSMHSRTHLLAISSMNSVAYGQALPRIRQVDGVLEYPDEDDVPSDVSSLVIVSANCTPNVEAASNLRAYLEVAASGSDDHTLRSDIELRRESTANSADASSKRLQAYLLQANSSSVKKDSLVDDERKPFGEKPEKLGKAALYAAGSVSEEDLSRFPAWLERLPRDEGSSAVSQ